MMNYVCAFSQSESRKYFEWIIIHIKDRAEQNDTEFITTWMWMVMMNYVCAFSQSESRKYFEWIIIHIKDRAEQNDTEFITTWMWMTIIIVCINVGYVCLRQANALTQCSCQYFF